MPALRILNPATGGTVATVDADTPDSVRSKYRAARAAQPAWAAQPLRARVAAIARFRGMLEKDVARLARVLTSEVGKPIVQSENEINGVLGRIDFFLKEAPRVLRPERVWNKRESSGSRMTEVIEHTPLGVVANVSAWNYPYFVGSNVFIPALLTGNAVLYKPSEYSTLTGLEIARRLHASGVPDDAFVPVVGGGATGSALVAQPVDGVFFTGSYATGRKIARRAASRMIKVQLELGGKDPAYVCEDVDVRNSAASLADGAFYNCGQSCCSVERIYVHRSIYGAFIEAFVETVAGFQIGDPTRRSTYIGPLARAAQLSVVEEQIADAVRKGGSVLCGGKRIKGRGNYFEPTVIVDVDHRMRVMREESFGPVIGIMPVHDDEQAVQLMNDNEYGLTAAVYCAKRSRAEKILSAVHSGSAYWNCCDRVSPRLPWSGVGHSGIGLTLSTYGIQTFTRPKGWHLREG
jgi:acyl-CoA reductase-like NAD-dependent aldehyde dehydrogenase